jgi:hypothetical protein
MISCTISGCNADADIKMFHYYFDEELQDYICKRMIIACDKHAKEIRKKVDQKITG